jgi:ketosteroid isomerase-like protein
MNAQTSVEAFLAAFALLDLDGMLAHFAGDASAFFPVEHAPERLEGRAAIRDGFAGVIVRARARGIVQLPLAVADLRAAEWGDAALVTAHLRDERLGRRTFVLRRDGAAWRIVHLHASNAD